MRYIFLLFFCSAFFLINGAQTNKNVFGSMLDEYSQNVRSSPETADDQLSEAIARYVDQDAQSTDTQSCEIQIKLAIERLAMTNSWVDALGRMVEHNHIGDLDNILSQEKKEPFFSAHELDKVRKIIKEIWTSFQNHQEKASQSCENRVNLSGLDRTLIKVQAPEGVR